MTEQIETLAKYLPRLSREDQMIIVNVLNRDSVKYHHVHRGMLTFIPLQHVALLLADCRRSTTGEPGPLGAGQRRYAQILSKLGWPSPSKTEHATFYIYLDTNKVFKRFGKHPELGKAIPGAVPIKRKRDRKMFERKTDAYDTHPPRMVLTPYPAPQWSNGCGLEQWRCEVPHRYRDQAHTWLTEFCR